MAHHDQPVYNVAAMEPPIQYAQTADGMSIAWRLREGLPFVSMPALPVSHIQLERQIPEYRSWYERLAEKRMLVRYDGRGTGLSERDVTDYLLDAHVLGLEAAADRLGPESRSASAGELRASRCVR